MQTQQDVSREQLIVRSKEIINRVTLGKNNFPGLPFLFMLQVAPLNSLLLLYPSSGFFSICLVAFKRDNLDMAVGVASSSSSAALCSSSDLKQYDVFISFRGEDTRRNFTSHLLAALQQNQIRAYIDNQTEKGKEVWPELVHAMDNSYLCVVIFSETFASSTWCLKEITHMVKFKKEPEVIPVFYGVDPSQVRNQTGSYEKAFLKHEKKYKQKKATVKKWRTSLKKAANFAGYDSESKDYE